MPLRDETMSAGHWNLDRAVRSRLYGIDCVGLLEWHGWRPGGEFRKKLKLKNVCKDVLRIKYRLPKTKYFSMDFPESKTLSPGMHMVLDIVFRPVVLEEYDDVVEIATTHGSFQVRVLATLLEQSFAFPKKLDLGLCPVGVRTSQKFLVKNNGEVTISVRIDCKEPFSVSPRAFSLQPGAHTELEAAVHPTEAAVLVAKALCTIPGDETRTLHLSAVSKFPFLRPTETTHTFGSVICGGEVDRELVLRNDSLVPARFFVQPLDKRPSSAFDISASEGTVNPDCALAFRIRFKPQAADAQYRERFAFHAPSGKLFVLECIGEGASPDVAVSATVLDFGDVPVGQVCKRKLEVVNRSASSVSITFSRAENSVFSFSSTTFHLKGHASHSIIVAFSPSSPINFFKRVFLVFVGGTPIPVSLLGSGFAERARPLPFSNAHVERFFGTRNLLEQSSSKKTLSGTQTRDKLVRWSMLLDQEARPQSCSCEPMSIDFGNVSAFSLASPRPITVSNSSSVKMSVIWPAIQEQQVFAIFPSSADLNPGERRDFTVQFRPPSGERFFAESIEGFAYPKVQRNFRLVSDDSFVPPTCLRVDMTGSSFARGTEVIISRAAFDRKDLCFAPCHIGDRVCATVALWNRGEMPFTYAIRVDEPADKDSLTVYPPSGLVGAGGFAVVCFAWSPKRPGTLRSRATCIVNGSTVDAVVLPLHGEALRPMIALPQSGEVIMKPACVGSAAVRAIPLHNPCPFPVRYSWSSRGKDKAAFETFPEDGILEANESAEVLVYFRPTRTGPHEGRLVCAAFSVSDDGSGPAGAGFADGSSAPLLIRAQGADGAISFEPNYLQFEGVRVLAEKNQKVTLVNTSPCDIFCSIDARVIPCVALDRSTRGEEPVKGHATTPAIVRIEPSSLMVASHSKTVFQVNVKALQRCRVRIEGRALLDADPRLQVFPMGSVASLSPQRSSSSSLLPSTLRQSATHGRDSKVKKGNPRQLSSTKGTDQDDLRALLPGARYADAGAGECVVAPATRERFVPIGPTWSAEVDADYPIISITDVRADGLDMTYLWSTLNAQQINRVLSSDLNERERDLLSETNTITRVVDLERILESVDVAGPPGTLHGPPSSVFVAVKNTGRCTATFSFKFPDDSDVEIEQWASAGAASNRAAEIAEIQDRNVFVVEPRQARLSPGETAIVTFRFSYLMAGTTELPIVLGVDGGKSLVMQLRCDAREQHVRAIDIAPHAGQLSPVLLGRRHCPMQFVRLFNFGTQDVEYRLDTDVLEHITRENFGMQVLQCFDAEGRVPARSFRDIRWRFSPLEQRKYCAKVPILIEGKEYANLSIEGVGVMPAHTTDGEEEGSWDRGENSGSVGRGILVRSHVDERIPLSQEALLPGQGVRLGHDLLDFATVPTGTLQQRIAVVINDNDDAAEFEWEQLVIRSSELHGTSMNPAELPAILRAALPESVSLAFSTVSDAKFGDLCVRVEPSSGTLPPHSRIVCKVWLWSGGSAAVLEQSLALHSRIVPRANHNSTASAAAVRDNAEDGRRVRMEEGAAAYRNRPPTLVGDSQRNGSTATVRTSDRIAKSHRSVIDVSTATMRSTAQRSRLASGLSRTGGERLFQATSGPPSDTHVSSHSGPAVSKDREDEEANGDGWFVDTAAHLRAQVCLWDDAPLLGADTSRSYVSRHTLGGGAVVGESSAQSNVAKIEETENEFPVPEDAVDGALRTLLRDAVFSIGATGVADDVGATARSVNAAAESDSHGESTLPARSSAFWEVFERIMEDTAFNIISDIVHGEFDLLRPPRMVVEGLPVER